MDSKHSPSDVIDHREDVEKHNGHHQIDAVHGFATNSDSLPKGYYTSFKFLGTMLATGLGLASAVGGFGLAAPALGLINAEIGPDPNLVWVPLSYTLTLAIGLILVGRLSDLFGRRVSLTYILSRIEPKENSNKHKSVVLHRLGCTLTNWMYCERHSPKCRSTCWWNHLDRPRCLRTTIFCLHHGRAGAYEGEFSTFISLKALC
jgi:hypothetical protein